LVGGGGAGPLPLQTPPRKTGGAGGGGVGG